MPWEPTSRGAESACNLSSKFTSPIVPEQDNADRIKYLYKNCDVFS